MALLEGNVGWPVLECLRLFLEPFPKQASQNGSKRLEHRIDNCSKMVPKWLQYGFWRHLGGSLESSWSILGRGSPLGSLLEGSWRPPGGLGAKKNSGEPSKAILRRPKGLVSAILEAKRLPKWRPRGSKMESKRRLEPKTRFLLKRLFFRWCSLIFEVPGSLFGGQSRCKIASDCSLAARKVIKRAPRPS